MEPSFSTHPSNTNLRLTFSGYNEKLAEFAVFVTRNLASKRDLPTKDDDFVKYVDLLNRTYTSFDVNQPYAHASYYAQLTLQPSQFVYDNRQLREELQRIELSDLVSFVNILWTSGKGECLVQGNFDESDALGLVRSIDKVLPFKPVPESEIPPRLSVLPLPTSESPAGIPRLLIAEPNPANTNSVSYVTLQNLGMDSKEHVLIELLHTAVIDEPFYDSLRTQRQLGYIVSSGIKNIANTRTLSFIVQSSVQPSSSLTKEILNFIQSIEGMIKQLSNADLASLVKSLISARLEPIKDLSVDVMRNWAEISSGKLQFDRLLQEVVALLDLDETSIKAELLETWRRMYGSGQRVLITEMIPQNEAAPLRTTGYGTNDYPRNSFILGVDDIEQFRQRQR
jgi:insulysin